MNHNLLLYQRPNQGEPFIANITHLAPDWSRSVAALGGYKLGTFTVTEQELTRHELIDWYSNYLGHVVREDTYGMTTWEGLIYELRLRLGGIEYVRTLDPEWWHNRVKVIYSNDIGERSQIGWIGNDDAAAEYGRMEYVVSLGGATATGAAQMQARHLREFAWPRSRMVGQVEVGGGGSGQPDGLSVTVAGFWATLNWRYYETSLTAQASALVGALVATSEWIAAGRIEANALSVRAACDIPQRLGDLIELIAEQGDASGNVWNVGVYAGKRLVYEPAPVEPDYYLQSGRLTDRGGGEVVPSLMPAGVLVRNLDAPTGGMPAGAASAWDDPTVGYVEDAEYAAPDRLRLRFYGQEESIAMQARKIERGAR
jgi:hypothetical protein